MKQPTNPTERMAVAARTREIISLAERFLTGKMTSDEVEQWKKTRRYGDYLASSADQLSACIYNFDEKLADGTSLVRARDVRHHLSELRLGYVPFETEQIAKLRVPLTQLAAHAETEVVRVLLEGMGWLEVARFGSLATGRTFLAESDFLNRPTWAPGCLLSVPRYAGMSVDDPEVLFDALETLGLSAADVSWQLAKR